MAPPAPPSLTAKGSHASLRYASSVARSCQGHCASGLQNITPTPPELTRQRLNFAKSVVRAGLGRCAGRPVRVSVSRVTAASWKPW
jgi:hypothetical protein